jgi:hypothetical protein
MDGIDDFLQRFPDSPVILDLLGTVDADEIRALVDALEPRVAEVFSCTASVGAVFGVRLLDGSRVAIKLHKLLDDEKHLDDVRAIQASLATGGFPGPRPLARRGAVVWDEWLVDGVFRDAHEPAVRAAMARELARFHVLATTTGHRPWSPWQLRAAGSLWPTPHNALFDFDATKAGAEWIDEIAAAARRVPTAGVEVVGHADWSAKHLRFDDDLRLTALYDWDSVTTGLEPVLVGQAAASFTYTEELDRPVALWPTAEEALAFIDDYEEARATSFDGEERTTAAAAAVFLRAYAARCLHAHAGNAYESGLADFATRLLAC